MFGSCEFAQVRPKLSRLRWIKGPRLSDTFLNQNPNWGGIIDTIIYGMGGGKMSDDRMAGHYPRIVDLAQAQFTCEKPQIAIVPTAHFNGTNEKLGRGFMDFTVDIFEGLGCDTEQILIGDLPAGQRETRTGDIEQILDKSHGVFVLGGDTRYLLEVVRERGLTQYFY